MDNKKFEQLIDLIINENEEQAKALFHDIVVEKSREIYESMMDEEGMGEGMGGQVGDLLDEIGAEEQGMTEEEEDLEFSDDGDDEVVDLEMGDEDGEGEEGLEDRVVDLEDKLDQLMAEFEEIMGGEGGEEDMGGEEDFGDEEGSDEEMMEAEDDEEETDESVMEAIALKNVPGLYGSKIGGDNGVQTKSTVTSNSGQAGMDSRPVKFSGDNETVPTSPKAPSNYGSKGETQVKGAGSFKNAPAQAKQSLEKAPAPTKTQASGVNTKSPVAESRTAKKRI
jgi:hypothetical protein